MNKLILLYIFLLFQKNDDDQYFSSTLFELMTGEKEVKGLIFRYILKHFFYYLKEMLQWV